jgi:hypothetical protein
MRDQAQLEDGPRSKVEHRRFPGRPPSAALAHGLWR